MKKFITILSIAGLFASGALAQERNNFYVGGSFGVNIQQDNDLEAGGASANVDFDNGYALGLFAGYRYNNGLRPEIEISYLNNDGNVGDATVDMQNISFMNNLYYDIDLGSDFTPYVGAGFGLNIVRAKLNISGNLYSYTDYVFG